MPTEYSTTDLERYLDEALPPSRAAEIEAALRGDPKLSERLAEIHRRRDAGIHSFGDIWRRYRICCPTRQELGSLLLGVLDPPHADYIRFHVEVIGCRICAANLTDMQKLQAADESQSSEHRRHKYFQSSAGYLDHPAK